MGLDEALAISRNLDWTGPMGYERIFYLQGELGTRNVLLGSYARTNFPPPSQGNSKLREFLSSVRWIVTRRVGYVIALFIFTIHYGSASTLFMTETDH